MDNSQIIKEIILFENDKKIWFGNHPAEEVLLTLDNYKNEYHVEK